MNEQTEFNEQPASHNAKKLIAYHIIERKGLEKPVWSRIGVAFVNRDGSINVMLDELPLDGRLQVREDRPKPEWSPRPAQRRGGVEAEA
jgi:hypothetical protein